MTGHEPSVGHLTEEMLAAPGLGPLVRDHARGCPPCRQRLAARQNLAAAAADVAAELAAGAVVPSYDDLLGRYRLAGRVPATRPGLRRAIRLAAALGVAQARLLPRRVAVVTVLGIAATTVLTLLVRDPLTSRVMFGLGVSLVVQIGTLAACATRTDPRRELYATLPVSPPVVFATRLATVLALDTLLAGAASVVAVAAGLPTSLPHLVTGWFGPALFAAAVGVICAVWRSPTAGAGAAGVVWTAAAVSTVPGAGPAGRLAGAVGPLWATSPLSLTVSVVLLGLAVARMARPAGPAGGRR